MSYRSIVFLLLPLTFSACSDPEADREIARKQAEVESLERQVDKARAALDSARKVDLELRKELDSLDMSR